MITEVGILRGLLIQLATYRNCDLCNQKIDRGYHPDAALTDDYRDEDMWPYWHCHASDCELRVAAEALKLPTAVSERALRLRDAQAAKVVA